MKRLLTVFIIAAILFTACSCGSVVESDKYAPATRIPQLDNSNKYSYYIESVADLAGYTLIYPEYYSENQMEDVYLLKHAIESAVDSEINIIPDGVQFSGKTIVIASSKRVTTYEFEINDLDNKLDYIVAVGNDEIVLGGNNYYADVRAIYDFVNKCIGYDDINGVMNQGMITEKMEGYRKVEYSLDDFVIMAADFDGEPIVDYSGVKILKDAMFNMILIDTANYTEAQLKTFLKWCARCGINVIMRGVMYEDAYIDCPVVWGHCIVDKPYGKDAFIFYTEECRRYAEMYSEYSWKPYVNLMGQLDTLEYLLSDEVYFDKAGALSFYANSDNISIATNFSGMYRCTSMSVNRNDGVFWSCINVNNESVVSDRSFYMWMLHLGIAYGAKGITYFDYSDIFNSSLAPDKNRYSAVKSVNREISNMDFLYSDYEYDRTYIVKNGEFVAGENDETKTNFTIDEIVKNLHTSDNAIYNVGCFLKRDGTGYAFVIVSAYMPDHNPNDKMSIEFMHDVDGVKVYRNGYIRNAVKDENGMYSIDIGLFNSAIIIVEDK